MGWRADARRALRLYPKLKRKKNEAMHISITPNYSGMPGSGGAKRTTEDTAMSALLSDADEKIIRAVDKALAMQRTYYNAEARIKSVDMVYFSRTHTIYGAAQALDYSEDAVRRWHTEILSAIYAGL